MSSITSNSPTLSNTDKTTKINYIVFQNILYSKLTLEAFELQKQYAVIKRMSLRKRVYHFYCKLCGTSKSGYLSRLNEYIDEHYIWHIKTGFTEPKKPKRKSKSRVIKVKLPF